MRPAPMKVWVAEAHRNWEGFWIIGIYAREEDAIEAAKKVKCDYYEIEEFEVQDA